MYINPVADSGFAQVEAANPMPDLSGEFMQLLLAQLRYQDPLDPMSAEDFMGQLIQLNSLTELQKMNDALQELVFLLSQDLPDAS